MSEDDPWSTFDEVRYAIEYAKKGPNPIARLRGYIRSAKKRIHWGDIQRDKLLRTLQDKLLYWETEGIS